MRRFLAFSAAAVGWTVIHAGQLQQPAPPPEFRADVDLVQVDVTVLDKNRKPVRNLTAADFTLFEDGSERPIAAFASVVVPPPPRAPAAWVRDSSPDVVTNSLTDEGRLVLIVLDRTIAIGEPTLTAIRIANAAIDNLGPGDEAAVVHTGPGPAQNFTTDRARLRRAVGSPNPSGEASVDFGELEQAMLDRLAEETNLELAAITNTGACYCGLCVLETITHAANALRDVPGRRKTMLFIGSQIVLHGRVVDNPRLSAGPAAIDSNIECGARLDQARERMLRALDVANLTVHSIDPTGLSTVVPTARPSSSIRARDAFAAVPGSLAENNFQQGTLQVLPDYTGGRAVFNVNAPETEVREILEESASYYLLGFRSASPHDGRRHRLEVQVAKKDAVVRARRSHVASSPPTPQLNGVSATNDRPPSLRAAISPVLPRRDFPLEVTTAVFASAAATGAEVVVTLGIEPVAPASGAITLNVLTEASNTFGRPVLSHRQSIELSVTSDVSKRYETFSRLALKPGRYEVRAAVEDAASRKTASVYTFVDVPSFSKASLTLSGVAISTVPRHAAADQKLDDLVPEPPTTRRQFVRNDRVTIFVRVHQGGNASLQPVGVAARIRGQNDRVISEQVYSIDIPIFDASRSAPFSFTLPVESLPAGNYLLTLEAKRGKESARRDIQFSIR